MKVGRGQLDLGPRLLLMPREQRLEQVEIIFQRQLTAGEPITRRAPQLRGEADHEGLVGLIDEPVLVADREAIRYPHADIVIGPQHLLGSCFDLRQRARDPAVDVLHSRDAGPDHLEGRIERIEVEIEIARHHPGDEPQLQRHVGRSELKWRQPDMMVSVDEPRQHDLATASLHSRRWVSAREVVEGTNLLDHAVLLQHGTVVDRFGFATIDGPGDQGTGTDD